MRKKENLFFEVECQQIQIEEIMDFEYLHVTSTIVIIILSKNYQQMPELVGESLKRDTLSSYLSVSLQNINFKETNSTFIVEKSGRYHHEQVIEVNTTSCGSH